MSSRFTVPAAVTAALLAGFAAVLISAHARAADRAVALTDLPQAGGVYGTVRAPHCLLPGHRTIAANRYVRVFYATIPKRGAATLACRRSSDRAYVIGTFGECQNNAAVDTAVVAGTYAAINVRTCSLTHSQSGIGLVNLRNGRVTFSSGALSTPAAESEAEGIRAMVLTPRGRVAWLSVRRSRGAIVAVEVLRRAHGPDRRTVLLDRAADIDPRSLRRRGDRVLWTRAGATQSASM
jgi:hypothetical protein